MSNAKKRSAVIPIKWAKCRACGKEYDDGNAMSAFHHRNRECGGTLDQMPPRIASPAKAEDLDDILERAFWHFDALHKAHYRDVDAKMPGPMSERDAFKCTVREVVLDALGVKYARAMLPSSTGEKP